MSKATNPSPRDLRLRHLGLIGLGLIHELSTPLSVTALGLELLDDGLQESSVDIVALRKTLRDQMVQIERMGALVSKFRSLMTEDGVGITAIDLSAGAEEIVRIIGPAARQLGRRPPEFRPFSGPASVNGDARWVQQALSCVLLNAIEAAGDHTGENARVMVRIIESEDMLAVEVSDNGPGFADLTHATTLGKTNKTSGLGVGLALAVELVELQAGRVELANGIDGRGGARVRLWLPRT